MKIKILINPKRIIWIDPESVKAMEMARIPGGDQWSLDIMSNKSAFLIEGGYNDLLKIAEKLDV